MHVLNISFIIKFLLCVCVCVYVCVCSADQSYLTLCDPAYYNPSGSSVHGIFQARILEWAPFPPSEKLPDWGVKSEFPESTALASGFRTTESPEKLLISSAVW